MNAARFAQRRDKQAGLTGAVVVALAVSILTSGCGLFPKFDKVVPDTRKSYRKSQSLPDLEVPPGLSTEAIQDRMAIPEGGSSARYSTYQERRADRQIQESLEKTQTAAIRLLENEHVLAVEGATVQIWPKLREFWEAQGYALELDDVELGVIETAWNENEIDLERDRFKIFAEPGEEAGTTVLYISHEGEALLPQGEDLVWQRRPRNVDVERGFVERLQEQLTGAPVTIAATEGEEPSYSPASEPDQVASSTDALMVGTPTPETTGPRHAELVSVGGGKVYLTVAQDFSTAWKTTGRALEKAGVDVKDSDKGRGVYLVELEQLPVEGEEPGVWNKLKFWDREKGAELQVSLTGVGEKTEVVVLNKDGRWETGDQAGKLLTKLHDALNSGRI
jgi:outer membrane protein assembly factor BamC